MQYHKMGLMDAYLLTRARRLNVLIQPNLRFFHELFGWEIELARKEAEEMKAAHMASAGGSGMADMGQRRIMYSWPAFCRDIVSCQRAFILGAKPISGMEELIDSIASTVGSCAISHGSRIAARRDRRDRRNWIPLSGSWGTE